jgi:hypothetical protein
MQKTITYLIILVMISFSTAAQEKYIAKNPKVITGQLIKITGAIKNFKRDQFTIPDIKVRDEDGIIGEEEDMEEMPDLPKYNRPFKGDAALQKEYPNLLHTANQGKRTLTNTFNGVNYSNVTPADPSIAAGPNHIIQMINGSSGSLFSIYNKSGVQIVDPVYLDNITGKGGLGDPIVLYDQLADRFLMTEFVNKNETGTQGLSIAVSVTNDPTGSWYVYFFNTGTVFPDYPKFSIWTDAYYAKTNDFNSSNNYIGSSVYAFDRNKMLTGDSAASMQVFTSGWGYRDYSMLPVTLQGTAFPPAGTGGLFAYLQEDTWTGSNSDSIGLAEFKVDFNTPANSGFINRSSMATANYSSTVCGAARSQCIAQPNTTVMLEALDQRIMNQPVYRNFGNYEGIVFSNVVNNGNNISGIRWYELVKTSSNWGIQQQSTYSPDNTNRFMSGICYDNKGNIALAYNVSSSGVYPGIRYTGRKQCDALNSMTYAENSIIDGTASNANSRYGDYSQLVCDPDGKTFWFTGMYNTTSHWSTSISSFTLDTCVNCMAPSALSSTNITNLSATLNWASVSSAVNYSVDYKAASSSTWISATSSTTSVSYNLTGLVAGTLYDWRIKTNCQCSNSSYSASQLTTAKVATCNSPVSLTASGITTVAAKLSWASVSGVSKYAVDYKKVTATTWTSATSGTTSLSITLSSLTAGTSYDYRVKSICSTSSSSLYNTAQFSTIAICPDQLESNNTISAAKAIPLGVNIQAQIASNSDLDFYSFSNTSSQNNIKLALFNLPANYNMKLFSPSGTLLATAQNTGTANETINYNTTVIGTYKVEVYGYNKAYNNTSCYTLIATAGSSTFAPEIYGSQIIAITNDLNIYPVPASQVVTITFKQDENSFASVYINDGLGKTVAVKKIPVKIGENMCQFDVSELVVCLVVG